MLLHVKEKIQVEKYEGRRSIWRKMEVSGHAAADKLPYFASHSASGSLKSLILS